MSITKEKAFNAKSALFVIVDELTQQTKKLLQRDLCVVFIILSSLVSVSLSAQLSDGAIVVIRSGNNYLANNYGNISVQTLSELNDKALWYVEGSNNSYSFRNVNSGTYLSHSNYSYLSFGNSPSLWNTSGNGLQIKDDSNTSYYINYVSNTFSLGSSFVPFTFEETEVTFEMRQNPWLLSQMGGDLCIVFVSQAALNDKIIPLSYSFTSSSNFFNSYGGVSVDSTICRYIAPNDGFPKNATLTFTNNLGMTYEGTVQQAAISYQHQKGLSGRSMLPNGMQGVHTERIIIYMPLGGTKALNLFETSFSFSRWYQYDTDETISVGSISTSGVALLGNKGIKTNTGNTNYTAPSSMPTGKNINNDVIAEIACDLSNYNDYVYVSSNITVEPTLSQRLIYEIRPAQQMIDKLAPYNGSAGDVNSSYLEEYHIIAPIKDNVPIGPKYKYIGDDSNYYMPGSVLSSSAQWYKNGSPITVSAVNNRVYNTNNSAEETVVYTLVVGGYGIAKFTVDYRSNVAPKIGGYIANSILESDYKFVTGLDFNGDPNTPLEWDESGYGFYYDACLGNTNKRNTTHAEKGEYAFMNKTTSHYNSFLMENIYDCTYYKTNKTDSSGKFLYVDATSEPGTIASLRFNNTSLCPGTRMYVSTWLNNIGMGVDPNVNLVVVGFRADGTEDDIVTYNSGDLKSDPTNRGEWKQVFFSFEMPQVEYVDYRLRIVNNAQSSNGNDFAIDDVSIYMQEPSLIIYQAGATCSSDQNEADDEVLMVRMNPSGFDFGDSWTSKDIYYQLQGDDGTLLNIHYENTSGLKYGHILFQKGAASRNYPVYMPTADSTGLELYARARNNYLAGIAPNPGNVFITFEKDEQGVVNEIYYLLIQKNDEFLPAMTYHCIIGLDPSAFNSGSSNCSMHSLFTMQPKARLVLNGELTKTLEGGDLCSSELNTIGLRLYGANGDLNEIFSGTCLYDWLSGSSADYDKGGKYEGFDYDSIIDALLTLRIAYPLGSNLNEVEVGNLITANQMAMLRLLVDRGMLELYKSEISRRIFPGSTFFTVVPVVASAKKDDGSPLQACSRPFTVTLTADEVSRSFNIGYIGERDASTDSVPAVRVLRYYEEDLMVTPLSVPLCDLGTISYAELIANKNETKIYLLNSTTDNSAPVGEIMAYGSVNFVEVDEQIIMLLDDQNSALQYKQGHRYDFTIVLPSHLGESCAAGGFFSVVVTPNYLMWTPQHNSSSWHRDANWTMVDKDGTIDLTGSGFVPGLKSNVIIPGGTNMPILYNATVSSTQTIMTLADNAQEFIGWDINFKANSCYNIYFAPGAKLGNQQWLVYNNAWVDILLTAGSWNLIAPPFKEVVTGDMHIPASGIYQNDLFEEVDGADNRGIYRFMTSFFNSESYMTDRYGKKISVSASSWTMPFNALAQAVNPAKGYSVLPVAANGDSVVTVRLPKREERYYYFGSYGEITPYYEDIVRSELGKQLVGTQGEDNYITLQSQSDSDVSHLIGNPYLSELDVKAFMSDGINSKMVTGDFTLFSGKDRLPIVYNSKYRVASQGEYVDSIPAMTSFLVHLQPNVEITPLHISPSMLCTSTEIGGEEVGKPNRMAASNMTRAEINTLRIHALYNGLNSSCLVVEATGSSPAFNSEEDSRLTLLSESMTPASVYTHDGSVGMAINVVPSVESIPLGFVVQDIPQTDSVELTFEGIVNFTGNFFVLDVITQALYPVAENSSLMLPEFVGTEERYILLRVPSESTEREEIKRESSVKVIQPCKGEVIINASEEIKQIEIYSMNGQLIERCNHVNSRTMQVNLSNGMYLIDITTDVNKVCEKVVVY